MRGIALVMLLAISAVLAPQADAAVTLPPGTISVPTSGTFLYVDSQVGDHVGQGIEALYRPADSIFKGADLTPSATSFRKLVYSSSMLWDVEFATANGAPLVVGAYSVPYPAAAGAPFMAVTGIGGCGTYSGEFDVNAVTFSDAGDLLLFDATFEQHCDGVTAALFGRIRIEQPAPTPGVMLPAGSITVPTSGSFLYLNSEPGDYIGAGLEQLFTAANATLQSFQLIQGGDSFVGRADPTNALPWLANIDAPPGVPLAVGSYIRAVRAATRPAGSPGIDVFGDGRGCNATTGKFDVDALSFAPTGDLLVFQATFEQFCDYSSRALYGRIRIENPAPTNVVLPAGAIAVPTSGSFLYVNSQSGDPIGLGAEQLYALTTANATDALSPAGDAFNATTSQSGHSWSVNLAAPPGQALAVRLYTRAVLASTRPAGSAGLQVFEDDRTCTNLTGKFDVDALTFWSDGELAVFQATFQQYCNGSAAALFGRVRVENPAPLQLAVALRAEGSVGNKSAAATIGGTVSCVRPATVALNGRLMQSPPNHAVVSGSFSVQVRCNSTASKWSTTIVADAGGFAPGDASATVDARTCQLTCYAATTTRPLQLNAGN